MQAASLSSRPAVLDEQQISAPTMLDIKGINPPALASAVVIGHRP